MCPSKLCRGNERRKRAVIRLFADTRAGVDQGAFLRVGTLSIIEGHLPAPTPKENVADRAAGQEVMNTVSQIF